MLIFLKHPETPLCLCTPGRFLIEEGLHFPNSRLKKREEQCFRTCGGGKSSRPYPGSSDLSTLSATQRVQRFYQAFSGEDQVLIPIVADPDAIASAMAVKRMLWRRVAGVTISNINTIDRPDNLAMVRLLSVNLVPFERIDLPRFTRVVLVDAQKAHNEAFADLAPDVVIDHHPEGEKTARFHDVRPNYGATATMMTEYLKAAKIKPSAKLATGLYYAIKTDTRNFERQAQIEDVRAFQWLFRLANVHLARKIEQSELQIGYLKFFEKALKRVLRRHSRIYSHLGTVTTPDVCVVIADFFMKIASITWSIVSCVHNEHLIVVFRNDGIRKNAGALAKRGFGAIGSAGGHKSMARAEIPLSALPPTLNTRDDRKALRWVIAQVEKPRNRKTAKQDPPKQDPPAP